jgi:hypothetical protein
VPDNSKVSYSIEQLVTVPPFGFTVASRVAIFWVTDDAAPVVTVGGSNTSTSTLLEVLVPVPSSPSIDASLL